MRTRERRACPRRAAYRAVRGVVFPRSQWGGLDTVPLASDPLHERRWLGNPAGRRWYDYTGITSIKEQTE